MQLTTPVLSTQSGYSVCSVPLLQPAFCAVLGCPLTWSWEHRKFHSRRTPGLKLMAEPSTSGKMSRIFTESGSAVREKLAMSVQVGILNFDEEPVNKALLARI